ncbi:MAG: organic hydroperoxide resistance protein [Gammaproteobacteria bacterium]
MKILYKTSVTSVGGRDNGQADSEDGLLHVKLNKPVELGGAAGQTGTNPEQLFGAGYSACFLSAMQLVAQQNHQAFPADAKVTAQVKLGAVGAGFALEVELHIILPGMDKATAQAIAETAHTAVCPYSNAIRNNVDVKLVIEA